MEKKNYMAQRSKFLEDVKRKVVYKFFFGRISKGKKQLV
jgi:hypothetical protein